MNITQTTNNNLVYALAKSIKKDVIENNTKPVIMVHENCYDGTGAALAVLISLGIINENNYDTIYNYADIEFMQYGKIKEDSYYKNLCKR